MNIYNSIKKEVRRSNLVISLSFILVVIIIISIAGVLFSISISPVVFAQSSSSPNSILDEYTYVCIKLNETIEERGTPRNMSNQQIIKGRKGDKNKRKHIFKSNI